jgi:hypothetical protein
MPSFPINRLFFYKYIIAQTAAKVYVWRKNAGMCDGWGNLGNYSFLTMTGGFSLTGGKPSDIIFAI